MTSRADTTMAAIVRELAIRRWKQHAFDPALLAGRLPGKPICGQTVRRHLQRAGLAVTSEFRDGSMILTPAGMAAVETEANP